MIDPINALTVAKPAAREIASSAMSNTGPTSFAQTLQQMGADAVGSIANAETVSMKALTGAAGPREVAEAVIDAERALQVSVAIRDKLVTSYLEISRMAI